MKVRHKGRNLYKVTIVNARTMLEVGHAIGETLEDAQQRALAKARKLWPSPALSGHQVFVVLPDNF